MHCSKPFLAPPTGCATAKADRADSLAAGQSSTRLRAVSLEQALGGPAGSLLSERWRLQSAAGAKNAGDILFTLRFD